MYYLFFGRKLNLQQIVILLLFVLLSFLTLFLFAVLLYTSPARAHLSPPATSEELLAASGKESMDGKTELVVKWINQVL